MLDNRPFDDDSEDSISIVSSVEDVEEIKVTHQLYWTPEEDQRLLDYHKDKDSNSKEKNIKGLLEELKGRTENECSDRIRFLTSKPQCKKACSWAVAEIHILKCKWLLYRKDKHLWKKVKKFLPDKSELQMQGKWKVIKRALLEKYNFNQYHTRRRRAIGDFSNFEKEFGWNPSDLRENEPENDDEIV